MFPPTQQLQAPSQPQPSFAAPIPVVENLMYKNDLHCYCQKLGIPLPVYQTAAEGCSQSIRFRSTVLVGIRRFTSSNTFPNRKYADQDAAKLALQHLRSENEATSTNLCLPDLVCQDKARCKTILNEFAAKIKAECAYMTVKAENSSVFVSSLTLNGTRYNGEAGKNKKEAEQLAALSAILSLLDDLTYAATISEVIKSKFKISSAFYEVKNFQNTSNCSVTNNDTNDMQMRLSQQTHSRAVADEMIQRSITLQGNNDDQGGSMKLTDKHCGHRTVDEKQQEMVNLEAKTSYHSNFEASEKVNLEVKTSNHSEFGALNEKQQEMVNPHAKTANHSNSRAALDERQQEVVNLQAKPANHSNFGGLDDKEDGGGASIEGVTISRTSYVPLPVISAALAEMAEAAKVRSVSQQNSIPKCVTTQDVTNNNSISAKKRPRNNSKKRRMTRKRAKKRARAETQVS